MRRSLLLVILICGIVLAGCPPRKVVQPEQPQPVTPEAQREAKEMAPEERITEQKLAKIESKEELPRYQEEQDVFKDIHFDFDKYDIKQDARPVLEGIASRMLKNSDAKILIEGHCDERGTNEYNLALGDRRTKSTRDYLIALGVPTGRIETISYGEEKPLCTEAKEECWAQNRRAHFVVLRERGK
ncbi:MAG: peptidoglycan-associated lipoprotein Pal [Nitrospirota bacterium]